MCYIVKVPTEIEGATQEIKCDTIEAVLGIVSKTLKFNSRKFEYEFKGTETLEDGTVIVAFVKRVKTPKQ